MPLHKSIAAVVPKRLSNFQGDFMFDVLWLDCILKEEEKKKGSETLSIGNVSKQSRFANFVIVNFKSWWWKRAAMEWSSWVLCRGALVALTGPVKYAPLYLFSLQEQGPKMQIQGPLRRKSLEMWHIKQLASSGKPKLTLLLHHCFHILISSLIILAFQTHSFNNRVFYWEQLYSVIISTASVFPSVVNTTVILDHLQNQHILKRVTDRLDLCHGLWGGDELA